MAEMGDNTQLVALSFATKYKPMKVLFGIFIGTLVSHWMGSTLGMVAADTVAIVVGIFAGKKLPEKLIKYISASIFTLYGLSLVLEQSDSYLKRELMRLVIYTSTSAKLT